MKRNNFFAELKRRNVIRFAGLYLVGAWLIVQVASTVLPMFGAPEWLPRSIVILLVIGFIPALVFSWAFEMTPQGLKRDEEVPPEQSIAPQTGRRMNRLIIAVLVLALAYFAFDKFALTPRRTAALPNEYKTPSNSNSVAVLAYDNLSDDKGSEYFSDGISEELLTVLQKIPGLRVAARTSAFSFKGKSATAQEIGQKLGVANLVEGSVRKAGETVRIAARLTKTTSGDEIWSENYTRDLKDVFAVQTELATTIVEQLRGQLIGGGDAKAKAVIHEQVQMAEKGGTKNVEAHEAYLQGRFFINRHSEQGADQARVAFERAVQLDPRFALAWAGLAQTHTWYSNFASEGGQKSFNAHLAAAREAVEKALAIEPNLPQALLALSVIQTNFDYNWKGANETVRKALALAPQDPALLAQAGVLAQARGEATQPLEFFRRSVALDPVNPLAREYVAAALSVLGHQEEAREEYTQVIELNPSAPNSQAGIGLTYLLEGNFEEAVLAAQKDAADWAQLLIVSCARWGQKRVPESDAVLAGLIATASETGAYQIAEAYGYRNDKDHAFEWLERARRQRDGGLPSLRVDTLLPNLHGDPRWNAFLRSMGLTDDQLK
jgi:TolB-like protein/Tfp pilus assembly protein PilF